MLSTPPMLGGFEDVTEKGAGSPVEVFSGGLDAVLGILQLGNIPLPSLLLVSHLRQAILIPR